MEAPAKRSVYSVSSLMVYEACPLQYHTTFVRRIPPPISKGMKTGTSVHSLIARHFRQGEQLLPAGVEPDVQAILDTFRHSRFNVAPLAIEKGFRLPFERGDVRGRIDVILPRTSGGLEIVDFKSGGSRPRQELARSLQLPLYAMAAKERFGVRPQDLLYTYYFPREGAEISFSPTDEEFERLAARVEGIIQAIQEGRFEPAPGCECHACQWQRQWRERSKTRRARAEI